ncbi:MAG: DUF4332 domain-containing protein [Proteobacteria bacterium]|nr:DUF4332 domain-containing protein [Pseudomonadota bacterium]
MSYSIDGLAALGANVTRMLKSVGIRTTGKLLEAAKNPRGRKALSSATGFDEAQLLRWANLADRMRIPGVGEPYAELMRAAGVETIKELTCRNPANLAKKMSDANSKRRLVRSLPSSRIIARWIEDAKKLPPKISY